MSKFQSCKDIRNCRFSILGLAKSGIAAANCLASLGADVLASDTKSESELQVSLQQLDPAVKAILGRNEIREGDIVIISPGIPPSSEAYQRARRLGSEVISEIELFYRLCPASIVAITGTDGKSTTTALIGHLFKAGGWEPFIGGNIGIPLCDGLSKIPETGVVIAEVSCFQLISSPTFRPRVSVFTNIAEDHLDYHGGFDEYVKAKQHLYRNQSQGDTIILNADDPHMKTWEIQTEARILHYSAQGAVHTGIFIDGDRIVERNIHGESTQPLATIEDIQIPGRHNIENVLASLAASRVYGIHSAILREGLRTFKGLAHRIQFVKSINNVKFYDDSKATNPHAAIAGIETFDEKVILIAGGYEKDLDFDILRPVIQARAKAVILCGMTRHRMFEALKGTVPIEMAETLEDAVLKAYKKAQAGDAVLLSPACSSFDMFKSYEHRGQVFQEIVHKLAADASSISEESK